MNYDELLIILSIVLKGGKSFTNDLHLHKNWALINSQKCGTSTTAIQSRIIGGNNTGFGQFPWVVQLLTSATDPVSAFKASGTIINDKHVITCAHIFEEQEVEKNSEPNLGVEFVRAGEYDKTTDPDCKDGVCSYFKDYKIEKVMVHENFDFSYPKAYDIALVRIWEQFNFNALTAPICLPLPSILFELQTFKRFNNLIIAGWGAELEIVSAGDGFGYGLPSIMKTVEVPVLNEERCYVGERLPNIICAGAIEGEGACVGDYGGPAMVYIEITDIRYGPSLFNTSRYVLAGITSFGEKPCGTKHRPSSYTRVDEYMLWILDHLFYYL